MYCAVGSVGSGACGVERETGREPCLLIVSGLVVEVEREGR